jgi:hypothetical protein
VRVAIYCPFLVSVLLGAVAPGLGRRLPPATATRLLTAAAVASAAAVSVSLVVLAASLAGDVPIVAALADVRPAGLAASNPVPGAVGTAAVAASCLVLLNAARIGVLRLRALLDARALCRDVGGGQGRLVVVDDDVEAVAVPAAGGTILASRAQLAALPPAERRALILHESAHLAHRHHLYRLVTDLAVAVDPLQFRVRGAVLYATERWADEVAAAGVGDRAVVARVLAREGLRSVAALPPSPWSALAMGGRGARVVPRVLALLEPAPRQRPGLVLAAAALVAVAVLTAMEAQADGEAWLDHAPSVSDQVRACPSPSQDQCGMVSPVGTVDSTGE